MADKLLNEPLPQDVLAANDLFFPKPLQDQLSPITSSYGSIQSVPHFHSTSDSPPSTSSDLQSVPECDLVESEYLKHPGRYNFSIGFASATSKRKSWYHSEDINTLFIKNETKFAVLFHMKCPVQANLSVRAMVRYSNPDQKERRCPVRPCSCNNHISSRNQIYGDHFIISTAKNAEYSETSNGDKTVTVDLKNVPSMDGSHFAVYSYASYTSCLAKKSKVATVFSLMEGDVEVGRDTFYCRVCACPVRDQAKLGKRVMEERPQPKRRKVKSESEELPLPLPLPLPPSSPPSTITASPSRPTTLIYSDPDMGMAPDEEGYYTFTWKLKDEELFHRLCQFKKHCVLIQRTQHLAH